MSDKETQSFANHTRYVVGYHVVLTAIVALLALAAVWWLIGTLRAGDGIFLALWRLLVVVAIFLAGGYARIFALKAQDRAIRAEESLRHYVLTGSLPDPRLNVRQLVGLRFASDAELPALAKRAAEEGLREKEIKQAVTEWRADTYRV
jgi:hypothetical protein